MYVGPWQEYYLAGGKNRKKPAEETQSKLSIEDMRRALLNSLDAETTRRAIYALEAANIGTKGSNYQRSRRKPTFRATATKLPPLMLENTSSTHVYLPAPTVSSANPNPRQYFDHSIASNLFSDSQTLDAASISQRTTVSEPSKPSNALSKSYQRSHFISRPIEPSSLSISKGYDTTAVLEIIRVDKHSNKFKKFFGACAKSTSESKSDANVNSKKPSKILDTDQKVAEVKKMQNIYIKRDGVASEPSQTIQYDVPRFAAVSPYTKAISSTNSTKSSTAVGDIDLTDDELALISKYFGSSKEPHRETPICSLYLKDDVDEQGQVDLNTTPVGFSVQTDDLNDESLLHWCTTLDSPG